MGNRRPVIGPIGARVIPHQNVKWRFACGLAGPIVVYEFGYWETLRPIVLPFVYPETEILFLPLVRTF